MYNTPLLPLVPFGENIMLMTEAEYSRFLSKTKEDSKGCLVWQSPLDRDGYGTFHFRKLARRAHRVAWYNWHGPIGDNMVINHTCRNRACVNPQHLQRITVSENSLKDSNSVSYINSQKTHCKKGHPFDKKYGKQRYCSICQSEKTTRLRKKWREADVLQV